MQLLVGFGMLAFFIFIVYVFAHRSGIYADKIEISVFKLLNIKISNKVKRSGKTTNPPEHSKNA